MASGASPPQTPQCRQLTTRRAPCISSRGNRRPGRFPAPGCARGPSSHQICTAPSAKFDLTCARRFRTRREWQPPEPAGCSVAATVSNGSEAFCSLLPWLLLFPRALCPLEQQRQVGGGQRGRSVALLRRANGGPQWRDSRPAPLAFPGAIVLIIDNGEPVEQEKAVSCGCLYVICSCDDDEGSSQTVLQVGVIPALVSLTAIGTVSAKDNAQRLLRLFQEQRQRDLEEMEPQVQLLEVAHQAAAQHEQQQQQQRQEEEEMVVSAAAATPAIKRSRSKRTRLCRLGSKNFTRAFTCLLK